MKLKLYFLMVVVSTIGICSYSQNVAINEDGSAPDPNAILDVKSFTKGVLIPRVSTSGRLAIPNTIGLLVYDTVTRSFWYNNGTAWQNIASGTTAGSPWLTNGNTGTTVESFIGTIDSVPLSFKVNNKLSGQLNPRNGNTFLGYNSGVNDTSTNIYGQFISVGTQNTGIGHYALFSNVDGNFNTAVGFEALRENLGINNTAVGAGALQRNTTGSQNTAVGPRALSQLTTGVNNVAVGWNAFGNSEGSHNTVVGTNALNQSSADDNTAIGSRTLIRTSSGIRNTGVGSHVMEFNTIGASNVALGYHAMNASKTGGLNTAIGVQAMDEVENVNLNTVIGALATTENNTVNATAIGFFAFADASNKVRIGNNNVTVIEGQVPFTTPSDGRYKFNVQDDVKGLDFIKKLRPVTYQFDVKSFDNRQRHQSGNVYSLKEYEVYSASFNEASRVRRSGFIAQDVEKAAVESGYDFSGVIKPQNESDHYGLSYESFVVPLVKAIQELNDRLERLEKENQLLRAQLEQK